MNDKIIANELEAIIAAAVMKAVREAFATDPASSTKQGEVPTELTVEIPLNEKQAATILGLQPQTMAVWRMKGIGPRYFRSGRMIRYLPKDVFEHRAKSMVKFAGAR